MKEGRGIGRQASCPRLCSSRSHRRRKWVGFLLCCGSEGRSGRATTTAASAAAAAAAAADSQEL